MRTLCRYVVASLVVGLTAFATSAANKRLLFVTHSGGYVHASVAEAEDVIKEIAEREKLDVTCWRFTGDPNEQVSVKKKGQPDQMMNALEALSQSYRASTGRPIEKEHCGRINSETLKNFDIVFFFTTGDPTTPEETKDLLDWIKQGGAFAGAHCATDTLYKQPEYGEMIGAYFRGHPSGLQKVQIRVEDPGHPAAKPFTDGQPFTDEIYIFRDEPYNRSNIRIILSADGLEPGASLRRKDGDYAVSWCRNYGQGKVFYTSLGHPKEVWRNPVFLDHLMGGLRWATGELPGDATPTGPRK